MTPHPHESYCQLVHPKLYTHYWKNG